MWLINLQSNVNGHCYVNVVVIAISFSANWVIFVKSLNAGPSKLL